MFQGCFIYDYKRLCYVYLKETKEQREEYKEKIKNLNNKEIIEECRIKFKAQEREKERQQDKKGQKWLKKRAL